MRNAHLRFLGALAGLAWLGLSLFWAGLRGMFRRETGNIDSGEGGRP